MSERAFWDPVAQREATAAVQEIERQTAAEVVVAVRRESGWYRAADLGFGAALALLLVAVALALPVAFRPWALLVDLVVGFGLGALVCSWTPALRRALTPASRRREAVQRAARAALVELGVTRTSGRWGVLVYVSMFEREAVVVPDAGVDLAAMGEGWPRAVQALQSAVRRLDYPGFVAALRALGQPLGAAHPRQAGDVNELPDEVVDS